MGRWLELDSLDNQNIVAALLVGSYTATADIDVYCTLYAQGLAGGGDYIYYVTVTPNGLSEGEALKTTQTLGATTYVLFGQTIPVSLRNGDAMKVYIDGLAGDTTTPDTRVNFYESPSLQPTTAGRTLDVDANGGAEVGSFQTDAIAAAAIKADAVTKIQAGLSTLTAAQVWSYATRTLSSFGTLVSLIWDELLAGHAVSGSAGKALTDASSAGGATPASLWAYGSRTLTQTAAAVQAALTGSTLNIYHDATYEAAITGLGDITDRSKLWFTIKEWLGDTDANSILQIEVVAGLVYINKQTLSVSGLLATDCSITIDSAALGNVTLKFKAVASAMLPALSGLVYDFKVLRTGGDVDILSTGSAHIVRAVTESIA